MISFKLGQHWQGTTNNSILNWNEAIIAEVIEILEPTRRCLPYAPLERANFRYIYNPTNVNSVGYTTDFYGIITEARNWRLVNTCSNCWKCWVKDPDSKDGFITCWKCELLTTEEIISKVTDSMRTICTKFIGE